MKERLCGERVRRFNILCGSTCVPHGCDYDGQRVCVCVCVVEVSGCHSGMPAHL